MTQIPRLLKKNEVELFALTALFGLFIATFPISDQVRHSQHRRSKESMAFVPYHSAVFKVLRRKGSEDSAVEATLKKHPFIVRGTGKGRLVALTFDDGPGPYTEMIARKLTKKHVPATFFQVGTMLRTFGDNYGDGTGDLFEFGNHTFHHPRLAQLSRDKQWGEIVGASGTMRSELGGDRTLLFRPPYRSFDSRTLRLLRRLQMLMVLWSVDSKDYERPGADAIAKTVISDVRPGAIVLMHDAGGDRSQTAAALPKIVSTLRRRHFRFVKVSQLIAGGTVPKNQSIKGTESGVG